MADPVAVAATSFPVSGEKASVNPVINPLTDQKPAMPRVDSVMKDSKSILVPAAAAAAGPTATGGADGGVRILALKDYKQAALSLAEAFRDDEVSKYFVDVPDRPDWTEEQKWDLHVKIMEYITYAHLLKGLVVTAGPDRDCVALWMPPGNNMDDTFTILRSGLWRLYYQLSREGKNRFFSEFFPLLHDTKSLVLGPRDESSWYLVYIGTKPSGRGKGYARKVIEFVSRQADEEGKACYLESSNAVNRVIYGKLGFEVRREIYLQRAEEVIMLDVMVREPKGEAREL